MEIKSIFTMIKKICIGFVAALSLTQVSGQTVEPSLFVGIDVVKPIIAVVDRGYILEPSLSYKLKDETIFHFVLGKAVVNRSDVLLNLDYQSDGYYLKAGVGTRIRKFFEPTFSLGYSFFEETGKTRFDGPYYGDWVSVLKQRQQLFFAEAQINFWIKVSEKFYIVPNARIASLLQRPNGKRFPTYYVPGAGFVLIEELLDEERNVLPESNLLTGGVSVKLVFNFF